MDLATARAEITQALEKMSAAYYRDVFDEWSIVAIGARHGGLIAYHGLRAEDFVENFQKDVALLRQALEKRELGAGEFDFVARADGSQHDVGMKIGRSSYLILNHTAKTMAEIRTDPRWPHAEPAFSALADRFRRDPLEEI